MMEENKLISNNVFSQIDSDLTDNKNEVSVLDKCISSISNLYNQYNSDPYMIQRIHNHIVNYLPNTLENELKNHEKRVNRNNFLVSEKEIFIKVFLSKNHYYYLSNSNYFYEYNGMDYLIVKEDDILHNLLSNISNDRILLQWKYRTKINVIKLIKERSLFTSIPESLTIQNIINTLYPSIFTSKNQVKYFLTIIGDNILKKNPNLIFLVNSKTKKFLNEIDNIAFLCIGNSSTTFNFMTKYHENHCYENCRLLKTNESFSLELWKNIIKNIGLNLLCVASHYSNRYGNSDFYIENNADDDELKCYAFYVKNKTQEDILTQFCNQYIENVEVNNSNINVNDLNINSKIEWKNIHFLWKQFIFNASIPNIIYSATLKTLLKEKFLYDEKRDSFLNITSKYLPMISDFIQFWESTITILDNTQINAINIYSNELTIDETFENDLELDEICRLFKLWVKQNPGTKSGNINEESVVKILSHFFPNTEIIEDKFILNVTCSLWNKQKDIDESLNFIKKFFSNESITNILISFDDIYNCYCHKYIISSFCPYKFIVSKRYFEKYLYIKLSEYIVYDKFISGQWLLDNNFIN